MTLKHVLKLFSKTEVQEDKTHPNPPLESEGALGVLNNAECYPLPLREREELLCERSELSNSGEGCKDLPSPDAMRHPLPREGNKVSCAKHTEKNLSSIRLSVLTTLKKAAFTLAEVLITLAIIGVVAIMTLTVVIDKINDLHFKNEYKKAYFDLSQVVSEAIANNEFTRQGHSNIYVREELNIFKNKFKVIKDCQFGKAFECWKDADRFCTGSCGANAPQSQNSCFIDALGRSWCSYSVHDNIYLVDTNGMKEPNRFGKDRWVFCFLDKEGNCTTYADKYVKVAPMRKDIKTKSVWCTYPPCNYYSWLYE